MIKRAVNEVVIFTKNGVTSFGVIDIIELHKNYTLYVVHNALNYKILICEGEIVTST
jgi:hypothetical protein